MLLVLPRATDSFPAFENMDRVEYFLLIQCFYGGKTRWPSADDRDGPDS